MASKQKAKGKGYEREVAKHLSKITGLNFERVPNSGAFTGGKNVDRILRLTPEQQLLLEGDILVPSELKNVRFECKFYRKIAWQKLFDPEGESNLNTWIKQAEIGARPYWFICFKVNNMGSYVVFDERVVNKNNLLKYNGYLKYRDNYIIVSMDNFFETNLKLFMEIKNEAK